MFSKSEAPLFVALVLAIALVFSGCDSVTKSDSDPSFISPQVQVNWDEIGTINSRSSSEGFETYDEKLADIARNVPGFAGMYRDRKTGDWKIRLKDPSHATLAKKAVRAFLAPSLSASDQIETIGAEYDFLQLKSWYDQNRNDVWSVGGINFTDIDEENNRLLVGVDTKQAKAEVERVLQQSETPGEAFHVRITEPIKEQKTLRDPFSTMGGGLQIEQTRGTNSICTLGFNVARADGQGGTDYHFVTNSHCSDKRFQPDNSDWWQPDDSNQPQMTGPIANEVRDPVPTNGPLSSCPVGKVCRYSDASLAEYNNNYSNVEPEIVRPTSITQGNINVGGRLPVVGRTAWPSDGEVLNKVGRTTGWTLGYVSNSCMDVPKNYGNIVMLCQARVENAASDHGDSGSPVFKYNSSTMETELYGILWGGYDGQDAFIFSAIGGMDTELAYLRVTENEFNN